MVKRVCILRFHYFPKDSHVLRNAITLKDNGFEVDVIALRERGEKLFEVIHGIRVFRIPIQKKRRFINYLIAYALGFVFFSLYITILKIIRNYKVIEVDAVPEFLIFATFIPKLMGAKVIHYVFDHSKEIYLSEYRGTQKSIVYKILNFIERMANYYSDWIIVPSLYSQKLLVDNKAPTQKMTVVYNTPIERTFEKKLHVIERESEFLIVSHGSMLPRYGYQVIVKALAQLKGKIPNLRCLFIGDGEYRKYLEDLVKDLELEDVITFTGWIDQDKLPEIISRAHVGIVPLIGIQLFSNKLVEYLALGIPPIVSDLPVHRMHFPEDCVIYFKEGDERDLAEKILYCYNNREKLKELGKRGRQLYESRYSWRRVKRDYLWVYQKLFKEKI